ncbi:hypothetical protein GBA52_027086 [Prunus armeniaca]|nr:hypothetical protein GBA52_027086 [Prunus armeniaca]
MCILHEDVAVISQVEKAGEPTVFTISCPNKTGLGCDLCRVILLFGLSICRGGEEVGFGICIVNEVVDIDFNLTLNVGDQCLLFRSNGA